MKCRHCKSILSLNFVNLGSAPPSNAYLSREKISSSETYYPLKLMVCENCWLVQTLDFQDPIELFDNNYAYFSSTSSSMLQHATKFADSIVNELGLTMNSLVIEIASNDGYLLRNFLEKEIPCLGIEPTASTANSARKIGIPTVSEFLTENIAKKLGSEGKLADLIIGNNVYAHVPDINDFTKSLKILLKKGGTITLEFPHLLSMIAKLQFDTIYHEHFSYLSLNVVSRIFEAANLRIWKVEKIPTHGGSLRVYGCHEDDPRDNSESVKLLIREEEAFGLENTDVYLNFQSQLEQIKNVFLKFLIEAKNQNKSVIGYGAAAKGNTLLNFAGVKSDLVKFIVDKAPSKQNLFCPGSHIPIFSPRILAEGSYDCVIIFPWNIVTEILAELSYLREKGTQFITFIPELTIH